MSTKSELLTLYAKITRLHKSGEISTGTYCKLISSICSHLRQLGVA